MSAVLAAPEAQASTIDIQPVTGHIGAEIYGIDIRPDLTPDVVSQLRAAFLKWKVLFFRDQPLTHEEHVAFGSHFGEPTVGHPVFGYLKGHRHIYSVDLDRFDARFQGDEVIRPWSGWHTNVTAAVNPPAASILSGAVIPPYGGDTQWTNLVAAYEGLSATMRGIVDKLHGIHQFKPPEGQDPTPEFVRQVKERPLLTRHPLVRVHPETGERALFVSPLFLQRIDGLTPRESNQLLGFLFEHVVRTDYTVRFRWKQNSVAFWDNRVTAHVAPRDI